MYFPVAAMIACAVAFYHIGVIEYRKGVLLFVVSIAGWNLTSMLFGWGWVKCVLGQFGLFAILTLLNVLKKNNKAD